jgi:hypothetical protein
MIKTSTPPPISYATEPRQLDDILAALDAMAVEAISKLQQSPAHSSAIDPEHAKIHGLLNALADLRCSLKLAA